MDTGAHDRRAFAARSESRHNQSTDRCEKDGGVKLNGWSGVGVTGPDRSQSSREGLAFEVAVLRECIDFTALKHRNLHDNVCRGPKPVQAHSAPITRHADQQALLGWLRNFRRPPAHTFVVHGEILAAEAFVQRIRADLGWQVSVPHAGDAADV